MSSSSAADTTNAEQDPEAKPDHLSDEKVPDGVAKQEPQQVAHQFPEGGMKAWMVVLGCWCISFASFGYVNSFGSVSGALESCLRWLMVLFF